MIHLDLAAVMECLEKDCGARLTIRVALNVMGTLSPRIPTGHGWQIGQSENGVFICRCPKHHSKIEHAPSRLIGAEIAALNNKLKH